MKTRTRKTKKGCNAADYYLRQAEAALGIASRQQASAVPSVQRFVIGACTLYVVARWTDSARAGNLQ
jgi:hypothetical protein